MAYEELAKLLSTTEDTRHLVDVKLQNTLLNNYDTEEEEESTEEEEPAEEEVGKSVAVEHMPQDDFGVFQVFSDLIEMRGDESQFSMWLHAEPLHDISPEEQEAVDEAMAQQMAEEEAPAEEEAGPSEEPEPEGAGSSPAPSEGALPGVG